MTILLLGLIWILRVALVVLLGLFIYIAMVLSKPDLFIYQPTFGENVNTLATIGVALGTMLLAYATFEMLNNNNKREESRRKDDLDKEKRDREERWLKEIKDWATNVLICGLNPGERDTFESPEDIKPFKVSLFQNITAMRRLNREGMAFKYIDLSNWKGLVRKSKNLRKAIGVQVGLLDEWSKSLSDKARCEAANTHRGIMNDIAESIIEEAQNIRSNLLKSK